MPPKTKMTPEQVAADLEEKEREVHNPTREQRPLEKRRNRDLTHGLDRGNTNDERGGDFYADE